HHIAPDGFAEAMKLYRASFQPSTSLTTPHAILAVATTCAQNETAGEDIARAASLGWLRFGQGLRDLPAPSLEEARAYEFDAEEEVFRESGSRNMLIGETARVVDTLRSMLSISEADELMVLTTTHDQNERKNSYERLAKAL